MKYGLYTYYLPVAAILVIYACVGFTQLKNDYRYKLSNALLLLFFFFLIALRANDVGNDTERYFAEFQNSVGDLQQGGRGGEIGFTYILSLFNRAGLSYSIFNTAYAILIVLAIAVRFSSSRFDLYFVTINCYFFGYVFMAMSGVRQMLAVSLFLLSCGKMNTPSDMVFKLVLYGVAISVHNSAVIALPLFLATILSAESFSARTRIVFTLIPLVTSIFAVQKLDLDLLSSSSKYDFYIASTELRPLSDINAYFWMAFATFAMYTVWKNRPLTESSRRNDVIAPKRAYYDWPVYGYSCAAVAVAYYIGRTVPLMDRFAYYFLPFVFHSLAIFFASIKNKMFQVWIRAVGFALGVAFMSRLLLRDPFGLFGSG